MAITQATSRSNVWGSLTRSLTHDDNVVAFVPTSIPNLFAWLDGQDSGNITVSGSAVTQWKDKSGNARHTADDASRRPTLGNSLNGFQAVTFGTSKRCIWNLTQSASPYTIFVVCAPNANTTATTVQYLFDSVTGRFVVPYTNSTASKTGWFETSFKDVAAPLAGPQILTWNLSNPTGTLYRHGLSLGTASYSNVALGGNGSLGSQNSGGSSYFPGVIGEVLIYTRALSASEQKQVQAYLAAKWAVPNWYTARRHILCVGDSLTAGTGVDAGTQSWPVKVANLYGVSNAFLYNDGQSGTQLDNMNTRSAAAGGVDLLPYIGTNTTLVIWGGTNDIALGGQSASNTYNRLRTFIQARKATGLYNKIVVVTTIPRADTATTTTILSYNNLIRTNWSTLQGDGANALCDLNTLTQFDADGDYNNATYYNADKIHLTDTGYGLVAAAIKATIDSLS